MTIRNLLKPIFSFLLLFISLEIEAQRIDLQISLITCSPGTELYSAFGHSAVRVFYPSKNVDWVYNYGTFNFNTPNFYVKFVRGKLNYQLSRGGFLHFIDFYRYENRSVYEDVLNLIDEEKLAIFDFLETNYLPENREYQYEFFFDNCATRIRDVLQKVLNTNVVFNDSIEKRHLRFRQLIDNYLVDLHWSHLGINLALGHPCDKIAKAHEYMFLPDFLRDAVQKAKIKRNGAVLPLVLSSATLYKALPSENAHFVWLTPKTVFWTFLLIVLIITFIEKKKSVHWRWFDAILFIFIGLIGVLLFFLWFFTDHRTTVQNWNLLWALPTHLIFGSLLFRKRFGTITRYYFLISGGLSVIMLVFWWLIPQWYDFSLIPLVLVLIVRALKIADIQKFIPLK